MKSRTGFVSNSSSTSFIISSGELEDAKAMGVTLTPVEDILKHIQSLQKMGLDFMLNSMVYYLDELEKLPEGCYISAPVDRDEACRNNWDFDTFEGDL